MKNKKEIEQRYINEYRKKEIEQMNIEHFENSGFINFVVVPALQSGVKENLFTYRYNEEDENFTIWTNDENNKENDYPIINNEYRLSFSSTIGAGTQIKLNREADDLSDTEEIDIVERYYNKKDAIESFCNLLDGMFEEILRKTYR